MNEMDACAADVLLTREQEAIAAWRDALGAANVLSSLAEVRHYLKEMGEFTPRRAVAVLHAEDVEQVLAVVKVARANRVPLYPVSTGRNWGLGSRLPVVDRCAILDLSRMNRIRELNLKRGFAVVEPGVTQAALARALAGTRWTLNVTASCGETSLLGNALERGVGVTRQRTDDLMGVEVVLGTEALLRAGSFWHKTDTSFFYRHGIGPDLVPLFSQSSFGVVTGGVIALLPRPERAELLDARFTAPHLGPALAAIQGLYDGGVLSTVVKIYNATAARNYGLVQADRSPAPRSEITYQLYGTIMGPSSIVERQCEHIRAVLEGTGCFAGVTFHPLKEGQSLPAAAVPPVVQRFQGFEPTCLTHSLFHEHCDVDRHSDVGWVLFLPVVPNDPADLQHALDIAGEISGAHGVQINATLNVLSGRAVDLVTSIRFKRGTSEAAAAHAAFHELHRRFDAAGYYPYRTDVAHMDPRVMYGDPAYVATLGRLKAALDPDRIIAPGRYLP